LAFSYFFVVSGVGKVESIYNDWQTLIKRVKHGETCSFDEQEHHTQIILSYSLSAPSPCVKYSFFLAKLHILRIEGAHERVKQAWLFDWHQHACLLVHWVVAGWRVVWNKYIDWVIEPS
jgi:hypothetical protein